MAILENVLSMVIKCLQMYYDRDILTSIINTLGDVIMNNQDEMLRKKSFQGI